MHLKEASLSCSHNSQTVCKGSRTSQTCPRHWPFGSQEAWVMPMALIFSNETPGTGVQSAVPQFPSSEKWVQYSTLRNVHRVTFMKSRGPESQIRLIEEEFLACSLRTARNMCEVFNKYSNIHLGAPNCPFYLTPGSGNTSCFGREEKWTPTLRCAEQRSALISFPRNAASLATRLSTSAVLKRHRTFRLECVWPFTPGLSSARVPGPHGRAVQRRPQSQGGGEVTQPWDRTGWAWILTTSRSHCGSLDQLSTVGT